MDIKTDTLTLEQSTDFVLKKLEDEGILANVNKNPIAKSLIEEISAEERTQLNELKSIDIDEE